MYEINIKRNSQTFRVVRSRRNIVINHNGRRGPQGEVGATGPTGATGATGPAGQGVPVGGTIGQVLTKLSSTNYDTDWQDPTGGGGGGAVASVNGQTGVVVLDTGDIPESGNLYFTNERVDDRVNSLLVAGTGIDLDYDDVANTLTVSSDLTLSDLGITASAAEINFIDGVTSAIQTQLDGKQPLDDYLTQISNLADPNADRILFWHDSASTFKFLNLGTGLSIIGETLYVEAGDVYGPIASTVNAFARFNVTDGDEIKDSPKAISDDDGNTNFAGYLRIGSTSPPSNTSAGDLTFVRGFSTSMQLSGLTASTVLIADSSKNISSSVVSSTELGYLSGVTSAIQTQINGKLAIANNLSDLGSASTARTNLGLGTAAVLNTGTSSGNIPVLDGSGKLNTSVLPALALTDVFVVASEVAQLALTAEEGDVAIRSDLNKSYIHNGGTAGTMADWNELLTPTDAVLSVDGRTGVVTLSDLYAPIAHTSATTSVHGIANTANLVSNAGTSVDNTIVRFDSTTGKIIQSTGIVIDDSDNIAMGTGRIQIAAGSVSNTALGRSGDMDTGIYFESSNEMRIACGGVFSFKFGDTVNASQLPMSMNSQYIRFASEFNGLVITANTGVITTGTWSATAIAVNKGGTGATDASTARTNLGLAIGVDVQAYDADLTTWGGKTAPSGDVIGTTDTQTLTNKRITQRVVSMADATSFTPTADTADINTQTNTQAAGTLTANAPSGTPTDGQMLKLRIKSTNAQTWSWNAIYRGSNDVVLPTSTTGTSKTDLLGFVYNATDTKWDLVAKSLGY